MKGTGQLMLLKLRQNLGGFSSGFDYNDYNIECNLTYTVAVFSPAYSSHVGPTSLQYELSFDVGMGGV